MNINTKTSKVERSSNVEQTKWIEDLHGKFKEANESDRIRNFANLRAFFDIDGGAWEKTDLDELQRQGRHPTSFNISAQKIQTLAGSILAEKFDFDYLTQDTMKSQLIDNIKHLYYYDKEQNNYPFSANKTCVRGLIHCGIEEMEIRYDIRPTGSIAFTPRLPGMVIPDPNWRSDSLRDWKRAMKDAWLTPEEILEHYQIDDPEIEQRAMIDSMSGEDFEPVKNVDDFENIPETHGSRLLVIEYRWIERMKTTRLYMKIPSGIVIPLPLNINEKDVKKFMKIFNIENADDIKEYPYEDSVLYFSTICPNGSTKPLVEKEKHPVQCGFIGFFLFSAGREMGINKGVMGAYLDIQRTINYRESKKDDIISSAGVGAVVVDESKLKNRNQLTEIKDNKTKPDYVCAVDGDPTKIFGKFPTGDVPGDIWRDLSSLVDMMDRVAPVTPALEGQSQRDESGILFEMRHAVSKLGTLVLYDNWMQHEEDKAEAWYNQAQITYRDVYMSVPRIDRPGMVEFNTPLGNGNYGNSIDMLPRAKVVVTLSKNSPTEQMSKRAMYYDIAKMLSANPEASLPQYRMVINKMIDTLELTPKEKRNFRTVGDIQEQNDIIQLLAQREQLIAQMKQGKVTSVQADMMLQQLNEQLAQIMGRQQSEEIPEAEVVEEENMPLPQLEMETPVQEESPGGNAPGQSVDTFRGEFQP